MTAVSDYLTAIASTDILSQYLAGRHDIYGPYDDMRTYLDRVNWLVTESVIACMYRNDRKLVWC